MVAFVGVVFVVVNGGIVADLKMMICVSIGSVNQLRV